MTKLILISGLMVRAGVGFVNSSEHDHENDTPIDPGYGIHCGLYGKE